MQRLYKQRFCIYPFLLPCCKHIMTLCITQVPKPWGAADSEMARVLTCAALLAQIAALFACENGTAHVSTATCCLHGTIPPLLPLLPSLCCHRYTKPERLGTAGVMTLK